MGFHHTSHPCRLLHGTVTICMHAQSVVQHEMIDVLQTHNAWALIRHKGFHFAVAEQATLVSAWQTH